MATRSPDPGNCDSGLRKRLAAVLPKDVPFGVHHVSTPPRKTDALFSAPPKERPDRTYCESHFLAISIDVPENAKTPSKTDSSSEVPSASKDQVIVLGVEIFIYTTAHSTILFVSKADSTGYLSLLNLPKGTPSPIRGICVAFISYLVEHRRRKDVQFIVSLFARAQGQYLFPGSVDHGGKHVLDDRGLIKWWCRVLDPLITCPPCGNQEAWKSVKGYLVVPGLDTYETRAFIPRSTTGTKSWLLTHPLEKISHYSKEFDWVPPRCLIPRFPDDPKSRFRDELDDEAKGSGSMKVAGNWTSVKTLDTFWEMMAYRQECSSGRMTGFVWVVFDDQMEIEPPQNTKTTEACPQTPKKERNGPAIVHNTTPRKLFPPKEDMSTKPSKKKSKKKKIKLRGPIKPRQPRIKTEQRNYLLKTPVTSAYYSWPTAGRGEHIVNDATYKRIVELMLHLNFSTLHKAIGSSRRWVKDVGIGKDWGYVVTGQAEPPAVGSDKSEGSGAVNNLSGLVKRKRADTSENIEGSVNVLSAGLVKKKHKEEQETAPAASKADVNVLSAGLVRKQPKT